MRKPRSSHRSADRPVDRRVQKTRTQLYDALIALTVEKGYDAIVVQDILDRANVGRSTFYVHFRDKDELLVSGLHQLRALLHNVQSQVAARSSRPYERVIGFSLAMFEHAYGFRRVFQALLGTQTASIVQRHVHATVVDVIRKEAKGVWTDGTRTATLPAFELRVHYVASTFLAVLSWWLEQRTLAPPGEIDAQFRALVLPTLRSW